MEWALLSLGLIILLFGGDALVRGAVNISLRVGIPALIVSLTIVAFGTSAPELLISLQAALKDAPGIAIGNVVGSNTANILLVMGAPAIFASLRTSQIDSRRTYIFMIAGSLLFIALALRGIFTFTSGLVLLAALVVALGDTFYQASQHFRHVKPENGKDQEVEGADHDMAWWKIIVFLVLGMVWLPLGANLTVDNAEIIARRYGVTEAAIGLTLVALGTSLPELATAVVAAFRRQADVAIGSVIGSNIFNLLAIIGITSLVHPIRVDPEILKFDLWVMLGASLLIVPFVFFDRNITRVWGLALTSLYLLYIFVVLT